MLVGYRVTLNKRVLSSIVIAIIATLAFVPSVTIRAHAVPMASLAVDPPSTPGNPGDIFTINVLVDNVQSLVAYDVQLHYNGNGIHATSVDFSGPFAGSGCSVFPVVESVSDAAGAIRAAVTTFAGCTVAVSDLTTGPVPVFAVTFQVVARQSSPLHISTDSECACSALAQVSTNGNVVGVPHTTTDGHFFAEPNIVFQQTYNVTSTPRNPKLSTGASSVVLSSVINLDRTETLAGFAFVVFDVITPTGKDITLTSREVFLNPGQSATLTVTFNFGSQAGTYEVFGTVSRGSSFDTVVPFQTLTGQNFRVH